MARILIVDDEPTFCDLLRALLKSHGHEVLTAYSGRDALSALTQLRPQFILLDLHMPGMTGLEVLQYIRRMDPKANVMIMTAWGTDELEQQARQLGATDFLSKTLSLDTLVRTLERALDQGQPVGLPGAPAGIAVTESVLLVDGDSQTRDRFGNVLRKNGFAVRMAQDIFAAEQVIENESPLLIVVDIDMPGVKVGELMRKLRARNYKGGLLLMTSSPNETLLKEAPDLGLVDILGKPVDPEKLLLVIQVGLVHAHK